MRNPNLGTITNLGLGYIVRRMIPTPKQCRAARQLIGMKQSDLAKRSGVSLRAIQGFESKGTKLNKTNHEAVKQALEEAGIHFIGETGVIWIEKK